MKYEEAKASTAYVRGRLLHYLTSQYIFKDGSFSTYTIESSRSIGCEKIEHRASSLPGIAIARPEM
jgi:hypothetical protein